MSSVEGERQMAASGEPMLQFFAFDHLPDHFTVVFNARLVDSCL